MTSLISQAFSSSSLYGHPLTSLPQKTWDAITNSSPIIYTKPDPGTAQNVYFIFENYVVAQKWPDGTIKSLELGTNVLPAKYLEISIRAIIGTLLTTTLYLTVAPIGIAINVIQLLGQELIKVLPFPQNIV